MQPKRGWLAAARALVQRCWAYEPVYADCVTWPAIRRAAVRTVCCAALLFAMQTPLRLQPHVDLYPSYVAALFANEGRWDRIYHRSVWLYDNADPEWDRRAVEATRGSMHGTSFVYHPWYLQALRPIVARLSYEQFQQATLYLNQACIVAVGLGISILLGASTLPVQALSTLVVGTASTTLYGMQFGQNVLPALVFALGAALAWGSRTRSWWGGLLAALAWTCKPWCALLLLLCFALRGVRAGTITTLAVVFVLVVLPELVMPAVLMRDYREMTLAMTHVSVYGHNNFSVLVTLERLTFSNWSGYVLQWLPHEPQLRHRLGALSITAGSALACMWIWWLRRPRASYAGAAWLAFLLIPLGICWTHYFVFAIPLACLCAFNAECPPVLRAVGVVLLVQLIGLNELSGIPDDRVQAFLSEPARYPWRQTLPIALVLLSVLTALWFAPREKRAENETC